tara:strand:+ start:99 stop:551 length:453 start_codon:yes stop_codon:yes gene_type:complete
MTKEELKKTVIDLKNKTTKNYKPEDFDKIINALDYLSIRKEEQFFHVGKDLEDVRRWWGMDNDEPNTWGEIYFLGKYIDNKGEKWDIGFQDNKHRKVAVLVYSNEAPCYMSPTFKNLEDAREQIARDNDFDYYEAFEEMINRAEAKGLIK